MVGLGAVPRVLERGAFGFQGLEFLGCTLGPLKVLVGA